MLKTKAQALPATNRGLLLCIALLMSASMMSRMIQAAPFFKGSNQLQQPSFLPVNEAFRLSSQRLEADKISLYWQIADGYYLYRHRLNVEQDDQSLELTIPTGIAKHDEYFGDVEIYYDSLSLRVPLDRTKPLTIEVSYQGCAEAGLCYPPQKRSFDFSE